MRFSIRFSNFAAPMSVVAALLLFVACKGRTVDNMEPSGDTIEVVITQTQNDEQ